MTNPNPYPQQDTVPHAGILLQRARRRNGVRRIIVQAHSSITGIGLRVLFVVYTDGSIDRLTWADASVLAGWLKSRRSWYGTMITYGHLEPRLLSRTFINGGSK